MSGVWPSGNANIFPFHGSCPAVANAGGKASEWLGRGLPIFPSNNRGVIQGFGPFGIGKYLIFGIDNAENIPLKRFW